ncbi:MAG: Fic family protein [Gammaproteobacteria bacterium]|nr:Fic family protein [Gammaproteobacteria bacterium]
MTRKASSRLGRYETSTVAGESIRAYVPPPLPPSPSIDLGPFFKQIEAANRALGHLDGMTSILPDTPLFLYMYVRKEALLSSQIEGTQSSLSDLLLYESDLAPGGSPEDVTEVSNYVAALYLGIRRIKAGLPLSSRLLKEVHAKLLRKGRGSRKGPGEFRRTQNWIGGTRPGNALYVPPPPQYVAECMSDLERFIHDRERPLPLLVRAGLAHAQFESIHPFLDGNGRLGRLLITLMLHAEGVLKEPLLYLSLYLKVHRQTYYDLLQRIRTDGDWERWLAFFLDGIEETSRQAATAAKSILDLFAKDRKAIESLGRPAGSALQVHQLMQKRPMITVADAVQELPLSAPTVRKSIDHLSRLGIVSEKTGKQRDRVFVYVQYMNALSQGTEPLR